LGGGRCHDNNDNGGRLPPRQTERVFPPSGAAWRDDGGARRRRWAGAARRRRRSVEVGGGEGGCDRFRWAEGGDDRRIDEGRGGRVDHRNRRPCPRHAATPLFAIPPPPGIPAGRDAPRTRRGGGDRAVVRASPSLSSSAAARAECGHRVGGRSGGGGGARQRGRENPSVRAEAAPDCCCRRGIVRPLIAVTSPPQSPLLPSTLVV